MVWAVVFHEEFDPEFELLATEVQDELLAHARLPRLDTLEGSRHANLKEVRFAAAGGVWRGRSRSTGHGAPCSSSPATRRARARTGSTEA